MRMRILLALMALIAVACAGDDVGEPDVTEPTSAPPAVDQTVPDADDLPERVPSDTGTATIGEVPGAVLDVIYDDVEARLGVSRDAVDVTTAESVVWSDGSLGCPEPGVVYTQAQVEGYRVVVAAAGDETAYHTTLDGTYVVCENDGATPAGLGRAGGGESGNTDR